MLRLKAATLAALLVGVGLMSHQARAQQALRPDSTIQISKAGMDPERLARITARMKEFVEKGTIPGAVMLVARHGVVAYLEAVGYQDLESKTPMRTDSMFQIRSMAKSIIAAGIMILLEEGRLTLTDPVEKHVPEFRGQMMVDRREGDKVVSLKKPSRPITIRDLLTHTSGMIDEVPRDKTLAEKVALFAREPLEFEPGTKFLYSDRNFDTLLWIIEVASGQPSGFLLQRIYRPLGMQDTISVSADPPEKHGRFASIYRLENGTLKKVSAPGSGRRSTALDMFAFYQMMLNGGTYNGVRILSRASVEAMTTLHSGNLDTGPLDRWGGLGSGLGWWVFRGPLATLALHSIGAYGHRGFLGTFGWVDPNKDLVGLFMTQRTPSGGDEELKSFMAMAAAAIADDEKSKPKKNDAGMDSARLAGIPTRMKEFVEKGTIAGAVMLVARHGEVALLEAVGYQDLESKKPMRTDTIFQIRSMTKSVTAVGIMILLEEGRLRLSDPVEKYLPEFQGQMMIDSRDGDKVLTIKKPSRPITIRDLLTHTSGVPGAPIDPGAPYREPFKGSLEQFSKERDKTIAEAVSIYSQQPLEFEPGTKFLYSDLGFTVVARIIEVVSGQAYQDFVEQRLFRRLGMKDSFFFVPPEKCDRIASLYKLENGRLQKVDRDWCRKGVKYVGPAGGMFSTALDMFAFYQMMLNGGNHNGVRILSRASVEAMTAVHTGDLSVFGSAPTLSGPSARSEFGYGLGWSVVREPLGGLALRSIGSYGHGGAAGTQGWIDPKKDLVGVFMIQIRTPIGPFDMPRNSFVAMANAAIPD